ncbi:MAG TPA: amidase family protein [Vicinamibacterales bacterium]|nr:amidase family protein [Vicinamibacterales bacterium]
MKRLPLILAVVVLLAVTFALPVIADKHGVGSARLQLVEATVEQLQKALQTKLVTSEQLVSMYQARMAAYEDTGPHINAYIHVNANADLEAQQVDKLRHPGAVNGPLYGIPILLKDNIDTADMPNTAGSVALAGSIPPDDAFIVQKLRKAGAIILGKGTLTEYANFIAIGMPTGYSSLGGFGFNPYDPRVDPRTTAPFNDGRPVLQTGGSSSGPGIGVNANLTAIAIGTETSGSILSPANANGIVGIKPTVGLVSRDGIIPITADQDTAGPLTRTVADAAILLGVIAGYDPIDPATAACLSSGNCFSDYTRFLDAGAMRGARIAVYSPPTPLAPNRQAIIDNAVKVLKAHGASVRTLAVSDIPAQPGACVSYPLPPIPAPPAVRCSSVLLYGFKRDLNAYLAGTPGAPHHTLAEIVAFNSTFVPPMKYGQAIAEAAAQVNISPGSADTLRYIDDRAFDLAVSRDALNVIYNGPDGIKGTADDTDAILALGNNFAAAPAKAGFPSVTVPGGFILADTNPPTNDPPIAGPFPQTVTFSGPAFSEPRLIGLGYAFEQATHYRVPPSSTPPLASDSVGRP